MIHIEDKLKRTNVYIKRDNVEVNYLTKEEFEGETTMSIPEEGDYEVYIYTESGTVMVGEFSVE